MATFETTMNLKVFSLVGPMDAAGKGNKSTRLDSASNNSRISLSLSEILSEEQWEGRRMYKMELKKRTLINNSCDTSGGTLYASK